MSATQAQSTLNPTQAQSTLNATQAQSTPHSFVSPGCHVVAAHVTTLVRQAAMDTNLVAQGYDLKCIGTHSLRASGAMVLKLQGVEDSLIMKIGCCMGLTILTYIQSQIGALNAGLVHRMTIRIHFVNITAG